MSTSDNWDDIAPICHGHTLQKYLVNIAPVLRKVLIFFFFCQNCVHQYQKNVQKCNLNNKFLPK